MELTYRYSGAEYSVRSVLRFTQDGRGDFWSAPFFHFFPSLDQDAYFALDEPGRRGMLLTFFQELEAQNAGLLRGKEQAYTAWWRTCKPQVTQALEDAFGLLLDGLFNDLTACITFNPVAPRDLERHTFDVFYRNSERGALGMALHEIIHFVWFHVWRGRFGGSPADCERPGLAWILSEMAVEPIMRDARLAALNPYFPRENGGCVYPYFYTLSLEGENILERLYAMYRAMPMTRFMEAAYALCLAHEGEIRRHIAAAEAGERACG